MTRCALSSLPVARPPRHARSASRRPPRALVALALAVGALGAGAVTAAQAGSTPSGPPVPADAARAPLGAPAGAPAGEGGFAFLLSGDDGRPLRFDPCRPVHWVVRPDGAPPDGTQLLRRAFAELSVRTGLQFVEDGPTDEAPREDRPSWQPERYGDRWAPVLIAWSSASADPRLAAGVAAYAGPTSADDGGPRLVTGQVVLDVDDLAYPAGQVRPFAWFALLHELGHLVGLGHVEDPRQLMHPEGQIAALGDGDLRGLAAAGSGPCSTRR